MCGSEEKRNDRSACVVASQKKGKKLQRRQLSSFQSKTSGVVRYCDVTVCFVITPLRDTVDHTSYLYLPS